MASPDDSPELVLGIIENYKLAQLEPFLGSLRQTDYSGDVVLFYHLIPSADLSAMRATGVTLIPFRNLRGAAPPGLPSRLLSRASRVYHSAVGPRFHRDFPLLLSASKLRYILYRRFLGLQGKHYRRVLLTDTRDVFFQANPLPPGPAEELVFFEESHCIGHGDINALWMRLQLGGATLNRLAAKPTLCSGTTIGTPAALCFYLDRYLELMKRATRQDIPCGDQALHNAVAYEGLAGIPYSVRYSPNGRHEVYTLTQYLETSSIARGASGEVVDPAGHPVPIVHQYDRHPEIQSALFQTLAGRPRTPEFSVRKVRRRTGLPEFRA